MQPARGTLTALIGPAEIRIEPRLMDLLTLFAVSDGRVMSKDEIIASVWDGRAIGDDTLAAAVSRLRAALGATREHPYIVTVPKRGYRLALAPGGPATLRAEPPPAGVSEAGPLIAQGMAMLRTGMPAALPQARLYFEAAITLDPKRAEAQAGLAEALFAQHLTGQGSARILLPLARTAAFAAVGLDEQLAQAWTARGYATLMLDREFEPADRAFLRAIALDPAAPAPHRYRAVTLASIGRFVEAERESRKAVALEPLSLPGRNGLLQILLAARRYRQVLAEAKAMLAMSAQASEAWYARGWALVLLGERAEGVEALFQGLVLWGLDEPNIASLRKIYAANGFPGLCAAVADFFESQHVQFAARPTDIAALRAAAGQVDPAFATLEAAIARDDPYLLLLPYLPWFDDLNNDPRWRGLIERARAVR